MNLSVFLVIAAVIAIPALAFIGLPLLRREEAEAGPDGAAERLRARLASIARDRSAGLIDAAAAEEAEIEAKRSALAAAARPEASPSMARRWRFAATAFLSAAPLLTAGLYLSVGAPALIDPPPAPAAPSVEAIAALPEDERQAMIESMVKGLAARLEAEPGDAEGWRMLARSQMVLGRSADSADSYRKLLALVEGDLEDWRNYATSLASSAPEDQFPTSPEFLNAIGEIEKRAPGDMMALFYRGGATLEAGNASGAAEIWRRLLAAMPEDAPVRPTLEALIADAEASALTNTVPK